MRKKEYKLLVSDILGLSLILAMLLAFAVSFIMRVLGMTVGALLLKIALQVMLYCLPIVFVLWLYRRNGDRIPHLTSSLDYNESAMLTVSAFGAVVLIQTLYSSVFPSVVQKAGIAETASVEEFLILFFLTVVVPALTEELFFRGIVLRALTAYRALLAILISSVAYALMHFSLEVFPLSFFCGFLIGSVYFATGSLGVAVGLHFSVNAVWFLAETVNVYLPDSYSLFLRILVAACVLLFAFGLPFLKKTVSAILADEHDDTVLPSSQFWGVPIVVFLITAISVQLIFGTL